MRRIVMVLILASCGCSGDAVGQLDTQGRLDVTPRLQRACPGITDALIDALIVSQEDLRLLGASKTQQLNKAVEDCLDISTLCLTCSIAIIDQVYDI